MSSPSLVSRLRAIVGRRHVITRRGAVRRFATGYREGGGDAMAVVRPGTLVEQWRILKTCVDFGAIVITQAANTGLTGGSTPDGSYDRPVIIVNTMRLSGIHVIDNGRQVVCLPGATLFELEERLRPLAREPHSVIGSSCFGASVVGGVCNNSGGALVRRGPAYTEMALFARVEADGALRLVNHLGIALGDDAEAALDALQRGTFAPEDVDLVPGRRGSDDRYLTHVRDLAAQTPARFNADERCLYETSGCAGRVMVFAVRLDTFAAEPSTTTFYVGANNPRLFTAMRREILGAPGQLPILAEYIHRDAFVVAERHGKDQFLAVRALGTRRLPRLLAWKAWLDRAAAATGARAGFSDRLMGRAARLLPDHLPPRLAAFRDRFEHHLILQVSEASARTTEALLHRVLGSGDGAFIACSAVESRAALLHRFTVAGAAIRTKTLAGWRAGPLVSLDIALPRDAREWEERLPADLKERTLHRLYYGHFLCYVFHQDYVLRAGTDALDFKRRILTLLDGRGAEYPAEHNVGHAYEAKPALAAFYQSLDPANRLNPGIGQISRADHWARVA